MAHSLIPVFCPVGAAYPAGPGGEPGPGAEVVSCRLAPVSVAAQVPVGGQPENCYDLAFFVTFSPGGESLVTADPLVEWSSSDPALVENVVPGRFCLADTAGALLGTSQSATAVYNPGGGAGATCTSVAPVTVAAERGPLAPGGVIPSDVVGLRLWLKADAGTLQTSGGAAAASDGDPVGQWLDQSAAGFHLANTLAAPRPTLQLAEIAGLPVVRFDGVDDNLARAAAISGLITASAFTVYVVGRVGGYTWDSATQYVNEQWIADLLGWWGLGLRATGTLLKGYHDGGGAKIVDDTCPVGTVFGARWRFGGGTVGLKRSGLAESTLAAGNVGGLTGNTILGKSGTNPAFLTGDIGEILVYNTAVSAGDATGIEDYLAGRWGITW